jgi:hypothetical protein
MENEMGRALKKEWGRRGTHVAYCFGSHDESDYWEDQGVSG